MDPLFFIVYRYIQTFIDFSNDSIATEKSKWIEFLLKFY